MRIWRINEPRNSGFACFSTHGTWKQVAERDDLCSECGSPPLRFLVPPLVIEWLPYGDQLADFLWGQGGTGSPAVQRSVAEAIAEHRRGFEIAEVRMVQSTNVKRPRRVTKRSKPRIWLPYEGPPLAYLHATTWVHLDSTRSTGRFDIDCKTCGRRDFVPEGVEEHTTRCGPAKSVPVVEIPVTPFDRTRTPGAGVFVREHDVKGADLFRIHEIGHLDFCTDALKEVVQSAGYSNITFWEYGDVV